MRSEWAEKPLSQLTTRDLCSYRDQRLQEIKATSLHRQFCIIKHAAKIAEEEWGWDAKLIAIKTIRLKAEPTSTVRRISQDNNQIAFRCGGSISQSSDATTHHLSLGDRNEEGRVVVF